MKIESATYRAAIDAFLKDRLQAKLDKLPLDDPKRSELIAEHQRGPWLESAARRVKQIQAVTHSLKPVHPDARGTNLYVSPSDLPMLDVVGSHVLGDRLAIDVVGNAAALDVYKLLKLEVEGRSLLQALLDNDPQALQALNEDPAKAKEMREALISVKAERESGASSHVRAKQLYWLVGDDANDDAQFHLLSPLHATSLAQVVFENIQDVRFGEANKLARQAHRQGLPHDRAHREYKDLAVQKLGGTKPQNVSQLNSERGGNNYLMSSLPPRIWTAGNRYLPVSAKSIFDRAFGARPAVRDAIPKLHRVLSSRRPKNKETRDRRDNLIDQIVEELVIYAYELLDQRAGWTCDRAYENLVEEEQLWLDPGRAELPDEGEFAKRWHFMDWPAQVGMRFGNWLNAQLRGELQDIGDVESHAWRKLLLGDITWKQQIREMRERLDAPHYIPPSQTHEELEATRRWK